MTPISLALLILAVWAAIGLGSLAFVWHYNKLHSEKHGGTSLSKGDAVLLILLGPIGTLFFILGGGASEYAELLRE